MIEDDLQPIVGIDGEFAVVIEADDVPVVIPFSEPGPRGANGGEISKDPDNRLTEGSDGGLYVRDTFNPDPLAYYILAKG